MGAIDYSVRTLGRYKRMNDALQTMREDARLENGHQEGYSGDIQGADDVILVSEHPRFGTKAFDKWEAKKQANMDKGDCIAIELKGAILKRYKDQCGFKGRKNIKGFYFFGVSRY